VPAAVVPLPDRAQADGPLRRAVYGLADAAVAVGPDVLDLEPVDVAAGNGDTVEHGGQVLLNHVGECGLHVSGHHVSDVPLVQFAEVFDRHSKLLFSVRTSHLTADALDSYTLCR